MGGGAYAHIFLRLSSLLSGWLCLPQLLYNELSIVYTCGKCSHPDCATAPMATHTHTHTRTDCSIWNTSESTIACSISSIMSQTCMLGRAVYIVAAKRTPIGAFGGKLKDYTATDLGVIAGTAGLASLALLLPAVLQLCVCVCVCVCACVLLCCLNQSINSSHTLSQSINNSHTHTHTHTHTQARGQTHIHTHTRILQKLQFT